MFKILTIGPTVIVVILAAALAYAATRPDRFQVQRSASINASADNIFPFINDLRIFNTWNPFDKKDPSIQGAYSGPSSGQGASYAFDSRKAGTGSLEIVDIAPPSKIIMRLTMTKPIHADNRVQFTLEPRGDATNVTWTMDGGVPFVAKILHLVFNVDKMIGSEFEAGLADLKALTENPSPPKG
jgi:hypothetical protein